MKLIIDIPEETYEYWKEHKYEYVLAEAIAKGVILPKGHGRLVDMSEVLIKLMQYYDGDKTIGQCLDEVHTVIEADGGAE